MLKQRWAYQISQWPFPARLLCLLGGLSLLGAPAGVLVWILHWDELAWIGIYGLLLWMLWQWARQVRLCPQPLKYYGLTRTPSFYREIFLGWSWGWGGLAVLFGVQGGLGWLQWNAVNLGLIFTYAWLGIALGVVVALAEELLFRSWLVEELAVDYGYAWAGPLSTLIFAIAHYIKPLHEILDTWPQFPGLVIGGWVLIQARKVNAGSLGLSLGLHAGWVSAIALVNNVNWINYTGRVPEWITGIGRNPLAGLSGILLLSSIAVVLEYRTRQLSKF